MHVWSTPSLFWRTIIRLINVILKQHDTGQALGRLLLVYGTAMGFYGMFGQVISLSTWYTVRGSQLLPWASFTSLLIIAVIIGATLALFSWKFVIPSNVSTGNNQGWEHDNPGRKFLEQMDRKLDATQCELAEIKAELKAIKDGESYGGGTRSEG